MFCLLPALIILSHSFSGMLETWCEQVMAEQWRDARYGGCTAGQPAVFKSITTSSSSANTTIAEGSSNSARKRLRLTKWPSKVNRYKLPVRLIWKPLSQSSTQTFLLAKPLNTSVNWAYWGTNINRFQDTNRFTVNLCLFTPLLGLSEWLFNGFHCKIN